jgi:hypothetical protein
MSKPKTTKKRTATKVTRGKDAGNKTWKGMKITGGPLPFPVGTPVYVRGAIYSCTGRIFGRNGEWLLLTESAYIATDGRFADASRNGIADTPNSEVEPVADGLLAVNIGANSDVSIHPEPLPSKQK